LRSSLFRSTLFHAPLFRSTLFHASLFRRALFRTLLLFAMPWLTALKLNLPQIASFVPDYKILRTRWSIVLQFASNLVRFARELLTGGPVTARISHSSLAETVY
jgi:hypothetical protein